MINSPNQFRMCSVCHNQRPAATLMLLPCCFRQTICLWCVAASVELRNTVECLRCGGNFHGPFVTNDNYPASSRMSALSSPQNQQQRNNLLRHQPMSNATMTSLGRSINCNIAGCGRRALNEACYHCGAWLCPVDDFIHKEDLADKHIVVLKMITRRAREWLTTFSSEPIVQSSGSDESAKFSSSDPGDLIITTNNNNSNNNNKGTGTSTPHIGQLKLPDSIETVDLSNLNNNSFICSKSEELQIVIERAEELASVLETKRARRLDLRAIASEIADMKRKVAFVEGVQPPPTRPTNIVVPKCSGIPLSMINPVPNTSQVVSTPILRATPSDITPDQAQLQLNALINSSNSDISSVDKLKLAIAIEEERLKERRKTLTPTMPPTNSPLPLLLVVSEIAANDIEKKKLYFHRVHGRNIAISNDFAQASRRDVTLTNGGNICFTNRAVNANERVIITCLQSYPTSHSIEIGFTTHDPNSLAQDLPESFANASWGRDEQSWQPGFWILIGRGLLLRENDQLSFCFNSGSQVIVVEGSGTITTHKLPASFANEQPAWAIIDLAGRPSVVSIRSGNVK